MSLNANDLLTLQNQVGGDLNKPLSTIDVLSSLKALNYFQQSSGINPTIKAIADNETEYLKASMSAINSSPLLRMKFGNDFNACMAITNLLKQENARKMYENTLAPFAEMIKNDKDAGLLKTNLVNWGS